MYFNNFWGVGDYGKAHIKYKLLFYPKSSPRLHYIIINLKAGGDMIPGSNKYKHPIFKIACELNSWQLASPRSM